jgi:hypothetical protein
VNTTGERVASWGARRTSTRKGQLCLVLARGAMNSCLCMFEDGYTMVTSRNALKLVAGDAFRLAALPKIEAAE